MQSKKGSILEVTLNVGTGYFIALLTQALVFPWFGINISVSEGSLIAAIFTGISILRGYIFRRVFNRMTEKETESWLSNTQT